MINFKGDMIHEVIVDHDCFYSDRLANIDGPFLNDNERTMAINYTTKLKKRSRSLSFELERMSNMNIKDDFGCTMFESTKRSGNTHLWIGDQVIGNTDI